jgi:hypothetical protein
MSYYMQDTSVGRDEYVLPDVPTCPGCGLEPEVECYWRETDTKKRVGFTCGCGARVMYGIVQGMNIG